MAELHAGVLDYMIDDCAFKNQVAQIDNKGIILSYCQEVDFTDEFGVLFIDGKDYTYSLKTIIMSFHDEVSNVEVMVGQEVFYFKYDHKQQTHVLLIHYSINGLSDPKKLDLEVLLPSDESTVSVSQILPSLTSRYVVIQYTNEELSDQKELFLVWDIETNK